MTDSNNTSVLNANGLVEMLALNLTLLGRQTNGLTHEDSLLQPSPRGNCLNWVLGHIARHREYMLQDLGLSPEVGEGILGRYDRGSEPVTEDGTDIVPLSSLLEILQRQQDRLAESLAGASGETLSQPAPLNDQKSTGEHLHFLAWHETYHLGSTELLRQLAGTDDQVI
jgi:hypothetical protein